MRSTTIGRLSFAATLTVLCCMPLALAPSAGARTATCAPFAQGSIRVVRLERSFGCGRAMRARVVATVRAGGYLRRNGWYCRWGQGGTRPVRVRGLVYYAGYCSRGPGFEVDAWFLAHRPG